MELSQSLPDYGEAAVLEHGQAARWAADSKLYVKFYMRAVVNKFKSAQQGRPIYDEKEFIIIRIPGDRNCSIDQPVTPEYRIRFKSRYDAFKSNEIQAQSGTPLEIWPQMTVGRVAELKALNIFTVEQLAEVDDSHGQKIMGFSDIKLKAQAFLDTAAGDAKNTQLAAELDKRDVEIAALKEQMNQILKMNQKSTTKTK